MKKSFFYLDISMNRESKMFEHKVHLKKEALSLYMLLHSVHSPNTSRGLAFSLLKTYCSHSSDKVNFSKPANRLLDDLLTRAHNNDKVFYNFEEVELKLMEIDKKRNNKKNMTCESSSEEVLEAMKPRNKNRVIKDMNGITIWYPTFHPKDMSRNKLKLMFNEVCKYKFQDSLNMGKCMMACYNPEDLRKLITSSSIKQCKGIENSANYHADKASMKMLIKNDMSKRAN